MKNLKVLDLFGCDLENLTINENLQEINVSGNYKLREISNTFTEKFKSLSINGEFFVYYPNFLQLFPNITHLQFTLDC